MLRYAFRRLSLLPLSLFLLSLVCFGLLQLTPDDPVRRLLPDEQARMSSNDPGAYDRSYRLAAASLGYDRPAFYFTLQNTALPDTLYRVARPEERSVLKAFTLRTGNWPAVQKYYHTLKNLAWEVRPEDAPETSTTLRRLLLQDDFDRAKSTLSTLKGNPGLTSLQLAFQEMENGKQQSRLLLPSFHWHGTNNQYHAWISRLLSGDPGVSLTDRRPVGSKIGRALKWTALLNGLAILLVYLISIPTGLYMAGYRGGYFDTITTIGLFLLFGIPSFWVATLLTNFFTTPAFGMDYFPSMGFGEIPDGSSWWQIISIRGAHLFLPVLCLAYPSWAYVSRHLRRSASHELDQAYIKTARLKGLSRSAILWRHVLRNASFPIITLLAGIFPAMLAGSVLIERIFNLPGMGQLLYDAALTRDWPVVIIVVLLNGLLTAIGLLLADLAYAFADPRVRLNGTKPSAS
ncbi:ABC transporter permease [Neolewinella aurantiaca]|uniref:ABC transporter permease n=1 Tax=Neolewinella aurantiaca TaxID=2602767 RepID=A0A5C7FXG3_9BACT|nr:ABC transporter permease [Neolewinella aurantiaca]TXF91468.1 ABC transporter permease [Neolewinella aurantiaca]